MGPVWGAGVGRPPRGPPPTTARAAAFAPAAPSDTRPARRATAAATTGGIRRSTPKKSGAQAAGGLPRPPRTPMPSRGACVAGRSRRRRRRHGNGQPAAGAPISAQPWAENLSCRQVQGPPTLPTPPPPHGRGRSSPPAGGVPATPPPPAGRATLSAAAATAGSGGSRRPFPRPPPHPPADAAAASAVAQPCRAAELPPCAPRGRTTRALGGEGLGGAGGRQLLAQRRPFGRPVYSVLSATSFSRGPIPCWRALAGDKI